MVRLALLLCLGLGLGFSHSPSFGAESDPASPQVESLGEGRFRLGGIEFASGSRAIRIPCLVNNKVDVLEYVLVHEQGKVHESLLTTAVSPLQLQVVLKLLTYTQGRGELLDAFLPPGSPPPAEAAGEAVELWIEWDQQHAHSANLSILDRTTNAPLEPGPWICTGSEVIEGKFQAEVEGSIIALYRDPLAMFNSPHPRMTDDENWVAMGKDLPETGHPVTLVIRPAPPKTTPSNSNSSSQ